MKGKNAKCRVSFDFIETKLYYRFLLIMEKKTFKVIVEVLKTILYAVLGLLGGNAVM